MKPYVFPLQGEQLKERIGYLNYIIGKYPSIIERIEDDLANARDAYASLLQERKELINGPKRA